MSKEKIGQDWRPTATGILLPPGAAAPPPAIERAEFAVKVRGFSQDGTHAPYAMVLPETMKRWNR